MGELSPQAPPPRWLRPASPSTGQTPHAWGRNHGFTNCKNTIKTDTINSYVLNPNRSVLQHIREDLLVSAIVRAIVSCGTKTLTIGSGDVTKSWVLKSEDCKTLRGGVTTGGQQADNNRRSDNRRTNNRLTNDRKHCWIIRANPIALRFRSNRLLFS